MIMDIIGAATTGVLLALPVWAYRTGPGETRSPAAVPAGGATHPGTAQRGADDADVFDTDDGGPVVATPSGLVVRLLPGSTPPSWTEPATDLGRA